ncbi:hypothetical protein GN956_G17705 [Arapaima gigas]
MKKTATTTFLRRQSTGKGGCLEDRSSVESLGGRKVLSHTVPLYLLTTERAVPVRPPSLAHSAVSITFSVTIIPT